MSDRELPNLIPFLLEMKDVEINFLIFFLNIFLIS